MMKPAYRCWTGVALAWLALAGTLAAQTTAIVAEAASPLAGFDDFVAGAVADWQVPGLVIAVVKGDQVVFAGSYGVRDLATAQPVDGRTLFAIGSTTKAFTAAALGILVDEGKLAWDEPVRSYLPEFGVGDPWVSAEIRVRDLLTHRTGLPNADLLWYGQPATTREILHALTGLAPATSLRSHFTYQNVMYAVAGELIATASDMSWSDFVTQRLLAPLGMRDTVTSLAAAQGRANVAAPHDLLAGSIVGIDNASVDSVAAAGSIWSSRDDMTRWLRCLLAGGLAADGTRLLSEELVREMFTPQMLIGTDEFYPTAELTRPHWTSYGLGWFQQDYRGMAVDFHTGSIDGMVAIAGLIRDLDLGVYVLANLDHAEVRHALMLTVFDAYIGETETNWSTELHAFYDARQAQDQAAEEETDATRILGTEPSLALTAYEGLYTHPVWGTISVQASGGLRLEFGERLSGPLSHWHYDSFRLDFDKPWLGHGLVTFDLGPEGRVVALDAFGSRFEHQETE